jgi:hypothetical protein
VTLTEHALRGAALRAGAVNRLPVGLPWYRSLPLTAVLEIGLRVDGEPVGDLRLRLGGDTIEVADLADAAAGTWFLQDHHELEWTGAPPTAARPEVIVRFRLQLPNLVGPDGAAVQVLQEVRAHVPVAVAG